MEFRDLESVRMQMGAEVDRDVNTGKLYLSAYFSAAGEAAYEGLLREAVAKRDEGFLATSLRQAGAFKATYNRRKRSGGFIDADVPHTAADTLSEGEFNRFYMRGVCSRAIAEGKPHVEVYRAKQVREPRPESQAKIGMKLDPHALLDDLRMNIGIDTHLGIPSGPNSGLSVCLPR